MAIFGDVFGSCIFPASRVQHVSDLHPKFTLRPHHVWKYGRHPICGALLHRAAIKIEVVVYDHDDDDLPSHSVVCMNFVTVFMVALPNIGGALCLTPQSLPDAHY